jgi:hypothetical protein
MKLIKILLTLLILVTISLYTILFTPLNQTVLLPYIQKQLDINSPLKQTKITKFDLSTTNFEFQILLDNQPFNIKGTIDLFGLCAKGEYDLYIKNLNDFKYITKQKLKGDLKATGKFKFKDILTASLHINKFKGTIDATLTNKEINVKIKDINSLAILDMLYYPKIFNSKIDLNLDYNIVSKQGKSVLNMDHGKFMVSQFSQMVKKYIKKDLIQEIYDIAQIKTNINNMKLNSTLLMKSKHSKITSKDIAVDLLENSIKSKINLKFFMLDVDIMLSDKLNNPKVKYNLGSVMKSTLKNKAKDKLDSYIKRLF